MILTRGKNDDEQTDLLHLERYLMSSTNDKYTYLREVTKEELLAFFGISYARDLLGQDFLEMARYFSVDVGHPIILAI